MPPLDAPTRELARKHLLALLTRRRYSLEDVFPMELKRAHEAQSDVHDNARINVRSLAELEASPSLRRLVDWLDRGTESDLLPEPHEVLSL